MRNLRKTLIGGAVALALGGAGSVQAFSFSIDDDDDYYRPYWGPPVAPGWVAPYPGQSQAQPQPQAQSQPQAQTEVQAQARPQGYYRPWVAPPNYFWYPRLPSYDRSKMRQGRQHQMNNFDDAMNDLRDMLYGGEDFDRTRAIQLARKIEATSGHALTGNFHPGSVVTTGSRVTTALWGNEEAFKANAEALRLAAGDFADELAKRPSEQQGAVYLSQRSEHFGRSKEHKEAPVSPQIWKKFNVLSDTCVTCHSTFRGPNWW